MKQLSVRWISLVTLVVIGVICVVQVASPKRVYADNGTGYPWSNATYVDANYDWGYSTCPSSDTGCMTLSGYLNSVKYGEADPWVYYLRNRTSYAADFNTHALAANYTNDSVPQQGDLAQWNATATNSYGHVAYVLSVTNGIATYGENNYAASKNYVTRIVDTLTKKSNSIGY